MTESVFAFLLYWGLSLVPAAAMIAGLRWVVDQW